MTITDHTLPHAPPAVVFPQSWSICWPGCVTSWRDGFDQTHLGGRRHACIEFVVVLRLPSDRRATLEAWLQLPQRRRVVLEEQPVECRSFTHGRLLHVDAFAGDRRLIAVTLDATTERLLYAQTSLLKACGLEAGRYDPPTAERVREP